MKEIVILGGPNGAGKTTAANVLLPEFLGTYKFLNADEIAREVSPGNVESAALAAGRILVERMRRYIRQGESFALETRCAGKSYVPTFKTCKENGWKIALHYFWLPSVTTGQGVLIVCTSIRRDTPRPMYQLLCLRKWYL